MKRLITLAIGLLLSFAMQANIVVRDATGKVVNGDTLRPVAGPTQKPPLTKIDVYLYPQNAGTATMVMGAKKIEYRMSAGAEHGICFAEHCYFTHIFVSPNQVTVDANDIDTGFSGHYTYNKATFKPTIDLVAYVFYDHNNPNDSAIVYAEYNTLTTPPPPGTSVAKVGSDAGISIYPNPATDILHVNIENTPHANALLQLLDAGGRVLATQQPHKGDNKIDIAQLPHGAYMVRYTNAEKNIILKIAK